MSELLIQVSRGPVIENLIRGDIAVVDENGALSAYVGDPEKISFLRSAAKPLQTSVGIESGAVDAYDIPEDSIAVMCGSHIGEEYHVAAIQKILDRIGLTEDDFTLGPVLSMSHHLELIRLKNHIPARKIYNNCSGKHSCMLAVCRHFGWDYAAYQEKDHPVQQRILETVAEYCEMKKDEILIGVDGCGVPVFAMPLVNMAKAYLNLCNPLDRLPENKAKAAVRITEAMSQYPEMVAGNGQFCTELIRATHGRIIGKLGADGIYCCAPVNGRIAFSVKIEDGNMQALSIVVMEVLKQLELISVEEYDALHHFSHRDNFNCQHDKVGEWKPVFQLQK